MTQRTIHKYEVKFTSSGHQGVSVNYSPEGLEAIAENYILYDEITVTPGFIDSDPSNGETVYSFELFDNTHYCNLEDAIRKVDLVDPELGTLISEGKISRLELDKRLRDEPGLLLDLGYALHFWHPNPGAVSKTYTRQDLESIANQKP